jgi:hypothetical protein
MFNSVVCVGGVCLCDPNVKVRINQKCRKRREAKKPQFNLSDSRKSTRNKVEVGLESDSKAIVNCGIGSKSEEKD